MNKKINSTLNLDEQIVVEFTDKDLTQIFALPRGRDIINENAEKDFELKTYDGDDFLILQYNETMPISEVKKIGNAVR